MTALLAASLSVLMIFTALLSGVFGMAGGLILIGVLLVVMPLPQAMVLHAVTQMASNGWRAFLWWRHIEWKIAAASIVGSLLALGLWSLWLYVPDRAVALLLLGISPFIVRAIPDSVCPLWTGPKRPFWTAAGAGARVTGAGCDALAGALCAGRGVGLAWRGDAAGAGAATAATDECVPGGSSRIAYSRTLGPSFPSTSMRRSR